MRDEGLYLGQGRKGDTGRDVNPQHLRPMSLTADIIKGFDSTPCLPHAAKIMHSKSSVDRRSNNTYIPLGIRAFFQLAKVMDFEVTSTGFPREPNLPAFSPRKLSPEMWMCAPSSSWTYHIPQKAWARAQPWSDTIKLRHIRKMHMNEPFCGFEPSSPSRYGEC